MKGTGLGRYLAKEQWWRAVIERQRASGLSIRRFCRGEKLSEPSFYSWRRELLRRDRESPGVQRTRSARLSGSRVNESNASRRSAGDPLGAAAFLPVAITPSPDHGGRVLEVACADGSRVSVWSGCEVELLHAALSVLTRTARTRRKGRVA